jgi:hypothetical protein
MIAQQARATLVLCALLAVGFYLRSELLWNTVVAQPAIRADAGEYFTYAYNLYHHGVYSRDHRGLSEAAKTGDILPDAVRTPGYPLFLTLFMGDHPVPGILAHVLLCQVLISTLTVALAYLMYRRFLNIFCAASAAFLTALCPHLVVINIYLLTETLFAFLMVLSILAVIRVAERHSWQAAAVLGMLIGAAALVRPSLIYFPFCTAAFFLLTLRKSKGLRLAVSVLIGFFVMVSPWHARNMVTLGVFADKTLSVGSMHHGIYPNFMYDGKPESFGFPYRFDARSAAIGKNFGTVAEEIVARFESDPLKYATWYLLGKPVALWSWSLVQGRDIFIYPILQCPYFDNVVFIWSRQVMRWVHEPLGWLCLLGCLSVWLPGMASRVGEAPLMVLRFISLVMAYFTVIHTIAGAFPRYSIPLRPFYYGMAMFACSLAYDHLRRRFMKKTSSLAEKVQSTI